MRLSGSNKIFSCILMAVLMASFAIQAVAQQDLRCESRNLARQDCPADTRGGVSLRYQYSSEGCYLNDTWGYDNNGVWVTNGCRADFTLGTPPPGSDEEQAGSSTKDKVIAGAVIGGIAAAIIAAAVSNNNKNNDPNTVYCASDNGRYNTCQAGRFRYAEMARQRSGSPCIFNRTWGYSRNTIWVDRGCRADFWVR
jgi:hypothetical protein